MVVTNLLPLINYGGTVEPLIETLEKIKQKNYSLIIPGHGDILDTNKTMEVNLDYLINVRRIVSDIIKSGKPLNDLSRVRIEDCLKDTSRLDPDYTQRDHAANLNKAYTELYIKLEQ